MFLCSSQHLYSAARARNAGNGKKQHQGILVLALPQAARIKEYKEHFKFGDKESRFDRSTEQQLSYVKHILDDHFGSAGLRLIEDHSPYGQNPLLDLC